MRLSENRIRGLAKKMAAEMIARGAAEHAHSERALADVIAKVLASDQDLETRIEAEARELLSRQKNLPPPGTGQYQAAFDQAKKAVAARKGIIL